MVSCLRKRPRRLIIIAGLLTLTSCSREKAPDTGALEQRIRALLELPTYEQVYRDIVYVDRERSFLLFTTMRARVLFSIDVRVRAGLDFGEGVSVRVAPDGASATVQLPQAKILLVDADESTIREYFVTEYGGSIDRLEYYDEINRMKGEIISDALGREILEHATINAQRLITGLLTSVGIGEVHFASM